ncbi:MAG TPA: DMT family transporter [Nevskiales bacterium]|nr:DMT family transporter [Nevskiales bacterium]
MSWFWLALASAFLLASGDTAAKRLLQGYEAREMTLVYAVFAALCLLPWLLWLPWPAFTPAFWGWVAALIPLEFLGMLLYLAAIRDSPLALTVPYLAFTPVFMVLTGYLVLGERVSAQGLAGIGLIVIGAYSLNAEHWRGGWLAPLRAIAHERGSRYMLGAAAVYSLTSVMGKAAMQHVPPVFFGPFYFLLLGLAAPLVLAADRPARLKALWRRPAAHLLIGLLASAMVITHFLALAQVEAAYMIAVKRSSLLFGILYGALLFGEQRLRQHLAAGALMVAGVAVLVL